MDSIRFILGKIIWLVVTLFFIVFALWIFGIAYPDFKISKLLTSEHFSADWLPAPKNTGLFGTPVRKDVYGNEYVPGPAFDGYKTATTSTYVSYGQAATSTVTNTQQNPDRSLFVRNLSIYEGGNISYGTTFYGEARDIMFSNGTFTILVLDREGRVIGSTNALNLGTWAAPGCHQTHRAYFCFFQRTHQSALACQCGATKQDPPAATT
jgi:hypothetical protein